MNKLKALLTNQAFTHTVAALSPILAALIASAVTHYPIFAPIVQALCPAVK